MSLKLERNNHYVLKSKTITEVERQKRDLNLIFSQSYSSLSDILSLKSHILKSKMNKSNV